MPSPAAIASLLDTDPTVLDHAELLAGAHELGEFRRRIEAAQARFATEMQHRSRPEDGYAGLAQATGERTAENLVQKVMGSSKREAEALIRVGRQLTPDADPWLTAVGSGVKGGSVSIEKADVIRAGLGTPTADVAADDLADAAAALTAIAPDSTVGNLAIQARRLRDELDAAGVRDRERALRSKRFLSLTPQEDGMTRVFGLLDPESAAIVGAVFDAATSPRRGGPRFVDTERAERAARIRDDERTLGQLTLDAFVDLLRVGSEADPDRLLGTRRHAVQVLVTAHDLRDDSGIGFFRDRPGSVSTTTVRRHVCDTGTKTVFFDETGAAPLQVGLTRRLFTARQRDALAARDGGCRFLDCERPASWCEAHHATPWEHGGPTDTANGILLCRHHHHLVHDNGWGIEPHPEHGFVAIPPRSRDPEQHPIPLPPKSPAGARLSRTSSG
jgi:hypothetical protein